MSYEAIHQIVQHPVHSPDKSMTSANSRMM